MSEKNIYLLNVKDFYFNEEEYQEIPIIIKEEKFSKLKLTKPLKGMVTLTSHEEDILTEIEVSIEQLQECDRCMEKSKNSRDISFDLLLSKKKNRKYGDTKVIKIHQDFNVDLGKEIQEEILLQKPYQILCKEDCKGLCQKCGANLNTDKKHNCKK